MEVNMNAKRLIGFVASTFLVGATAFAQSDSRASNTQQKDVSGSGSNAASMTVTGCLMSEPDYRKAHNLGKGALGGLGLGNEFVLVEGSCNDANGTAYRLTGKSERELKPFVGHRLEVTGRWDHARDAKTAAGETHAKLPPEIRIASYREAPAVSNEPASASNTPSASPAASPAASSTPSPVPEQTTAERRLPKTASNLPLFAFVGLFSLIASFGVRLLRLGTL